MDTQESTVMYSSVLRDPRVKNRRKEIVLEDEQPTKISRSDSRVSVSADVVGNMDISDFTESSDSGGVPGCSQVFESFGTSDSSVGSGGGASPGLEIGAFSPASVDLEDMCFGNVEAFCSITGMPKVAPERDNPDDQRLLPPLSEEPAEGWRSGQPRRPGGTMRCASQGTSNRKRNQD
ncbi:UNVERIFIED_CONTAM: hypothetical protein FKN15_017972 [Acipenser sinensis]